MPKKFLILAMILFLAVAAAPKLALADCGSTGECIKSTEDVLRVLTSVFNFLYDIFLLVAIIMILWSAFNYLSAGDDESKITSAHKQIIYALIAIAIALSSAGAVKLVQSFIAK